MRRLPLCAFLLCGLLVAPAGAQTPAAGDAKKVVGDTPPAEVAAEVGIDPRPNAQLPLDAGFMDEDGNLVKLGDYFQGQRPVLLNLVYFRCPSLCNIALNELMTTLKDMSWTPGQQFEVLTISINPMESPNLARDKKQSYLAELGKPEAAAGWHFLTGDEGAIHRVAEAVGFRYRFNTETQEYAHSAALFVATPDGHLSRTLFGVRQEPKTVRLSLLEAGQGKIGSTLDRIILYCYCYDPTTGRYSAAVMNIMRLSGLLSMFLLFGMIGTFLWRERRKRAARPEGDPVHTTESPAGGSAA